MKKVRFLESLIVAPNKPLPDLDGAFKSFPLEYGRDSSWPRFRDSDRVQRKDTKPYTKENRSALLYVYPKSVLKWLAHAANLEIPLNKSKALDYDFCIAHQEEMENQIPALKDYLESWCRENIDADAIVKFDDLDYLEDFKRMANMASQSCYGRYDFIEIVIPTLFHRVPPPEKIPDTGKHKLGRTWKGSFNMAQGIAADAKDYVLDTIGEYDNLGVALEDYVRYETEEGALYDNAWDDFYQDMEDHSSDYDGGIDLEDLSTSDYPNEWKATVESYIDEITPPLYRILSRDKEFMAQYTQALADAKD